MEQAQRKLQSNPRLIKLLELRAEQQKQHLR
jgi:hypothetical protein